MKKLHFLPLLLMLLACLCTTAFAASISGQQTIASISDENGYVSTLTDDDPATAWTKAGNAAPDLTITLYNASVGEIWIRSGYAYTSNWYNHYDRPAQVKIAVFYQANRYTESYDTYRYTLSDTYDQRTVSANRNTGYQRLLLPKKYTGVTKIELTIESAYQGYGSTGATIADIIVAGGSHATATPKAYATATPKPYVVYVTPTPGPENEEDDYVDYITPGHDDNDDYVDYITPRPQITATPYIQLITPTPKPEATREPIEYPSEIGLIARLEKRIATRSGPSNYYDEPGSFFSEGDEVKVLTKAWDVENTMWWFQVEFKYQGYWYRAYTPANRVDLNPDFIPTEMTAEELQPEDSRECLQEHAVFFGPGEEYMDFKKSILYPGSKCDIYAIEDEWAQIEYYDYVTEAKRRGWVPLNILSEDPFQW